VSESKVFFKVKSEIFCDVIWIHLFYAPILIKMFDFIFVDKALKWRKSCEDGGATSTCFVADNFCLHISSFLYLLIYENLSYIGIVDLLLA
jgi:hypothetical protein